MSDAVQLYTEGPMSEEIAFAQVPAADLLRLLHEKIIGELQGKYDEARDMFEAEDDEQSYGEMIASKSALDSVKAILEEAPHQRYHRPSMNYSINYNPVTGSVMNPSDLGAAASKSLYWQFVQR